MSDKTQVSRDSSSPPSNGHLSVPISISYDVLTQFPRTYRIHRETSDLLSWATYPHPYSQVFAGARQSWMTYSFSKPPVEQINRHLAEAAYLAGLHNVTVFRLSGGEIRSSLGESLEDKHDHESAYHHILRGVHTVLDAVPNQSQKDALYRRLVNDTLDSPEFISLSVAGHLLKTLAREVPLSVDAQAAVDTEVNKAREYLRDPTRHLKQLLSEEETLAVFYNPVGEQRVDSEWRPRIGDDGKIVIKRFVDGDYIPARVVSVGNTPYEVHVANGWGAIPEAMIELHKGLRSLQVEDDKRYGGSTRPVPITRPVQVFAPEKVESEA